MANNELRSGERIWAGCERIWRFERGEKGRNPVGSVERRRVAIGERESQLKGMAAGVVGDGSSRGK